MKLTREEALKLHRQMWSDMRDALGDNPDFNERYFYKTQWCKKHFPEEHITNSCFLCEYACSDCWRCPIKWPGRTCETNSYYKVVPISRMLALPERKPAILESIIDSIVNFICNLF